MHAGVPTQMCACLVHAHLHAYIIQLVDASMQACFSGDGHPPVGWWCGRPPVKWRCGHPPVGRRCSRPPLEWQCCRPPVGRRCGRPLLKRQCCQPRVGRRCGRVLLSSGSTAECRPSVGRRCGRPPLKRQPSDAWMRTVPADRSRIQPLTCMRILQTADVKYPQRCAVCGSCRQHM